MEIKTSQHRESKSRDRNATATRCREMKERRGNKIRLEKLWMETEERGTSRMVCNGQAMQDMRGKKTESTRH